MSDLSNESTGLLPSVLALPLADMSPSVAMAIADVFSKNGYTIPNKNAKILKIFERLETLKSRWIISQH